MNEDTIKKYVALAESGADAVKDMDFRPKTYELVLQELLRSMNAPTSVVGKSLPTTIQEGNPKTGSPQEKACAWLGTDLSHIEEVFEFQDNEAQVHISPSALPKRSSEAQKQIALYKLAIDKMAYGVDEVPARAIIELCDEHSCKDGNLAKNIKSSEYIVTKSGKKGTMKTYKIKHSGVQMVHDELQNVLGLA